MRLRATSSAIATGSLAASSAPIARHGHPGQADRTSLALAERRCRATDRIDPAECVDHVIVLGEMHLRRVLKSYADYYNGVRTHRSWVRWSLAKFSEAKASNHTPSLADFTTTTPELKFSVHTGSHLDKLAVAGENP